MNAMNVQMRAEILHGVRRASGEARVLVLTGNGSSFCSGQDLGDAKNADRMDLERTLRDEYVPMIEAITNAEISTLAAVNGAAAGAGANLALATDVVIAAESAVFLQAFTRIGLVPDSGGTYWLPRQIGMARAIGTSLFAESVTASQAAQWGMIWECVMAAGGADEAVGPALGCEMPGAGGFIGKARLEGGAGHRAVVFPAAGHDRTLGEHPADGNRKPNMSSNRGQRDKPLPRFRRWQRSMGQPPGQVPTWRWPPMWLSLPRARFFCRPLRGLDWCRIQAEPIGCRARSVWPAR